MASLPVGSGMGIAAAGGEDANCGRPALLRYGSCRQQGRREPEQEMASTTASESGSGSERGAVRGSVRGSASAADNQRRRGIHPDGRNPGDEVSPGTPQSGEAICPACAGSGRIDGKGECSNCGGTGKVTQLVGDA